MHEIGHTLGYIHTHSRIDRNAFVTVMTSNIDDSFLGNFFIWSFGTIQFADTSLPYDYASLLHYNAFGFSRNGQPTIVTLDPRYERTIGQREVATFYDYKSINRLYCARSSTKNNDRQTFDAVKKILSLFDRLCTDVQWQCLSEQRIFRSTNLFAMHLSRRIQWDVL